MNSITPATIVCLLSSVAAFAAEPFAADRAALVDGVTEIARSGSPGPISVFGPHFFSVVEGRFGKKNLAPLVAAGTWENGRIVGFGHEGYLKQLQDPGTARLLVNAVRWVSAQAANTRVTVAVIGNPALAEHFTKSGFDVATLAGDDWSAKLQKVHVVCADGHRLSIERDLPNLARFVRGGGGLVTAALGWGWQQVNSSKRLVTDLPANALLAPAGLVWADGTLDETKDGKFGVDPKIAPLMNATTALTSVIAHEAKQAALAPADLRQAAETLSLAMRSVPPTDVLLLPQIAKLEVQPAAREFPRADRKLGSDRPLARLLVTRDLARLRETRPEQFRAHPSAEIFPGAVPPDAPKLKDRPVRIDTSIPGWHGTGLYAPPGGLISVEIPATEASAGLAIRIGCHTDQLWHHDAWARMPEITRRDKLTHAMTKVASPFGGTIYIEIPEKASGADFEVRISGAVAAPRFVLGQTTANDWQTVQRLAPGPWAELESPRLILSVPSAAVRNLENPEDLMKFWDSVVAAQDELSATTKDRRRPERIVADVQISAGYMHSGYPIMTHLDAVDRSVSLAQMKAGSWGHFHEIGHNHQAPEWTFSGTGEVTCNIFALYNSELLCGLPSGAGHDAMEPKRVEERLRKHLSTRASFERWKNDPFLALTMYHQLREGFGWESYRKVFAAYHSLPKAERPKNDDEKRDQWLVRFSRTVGKNLGPFFQAWGVPTSETARNSLNDLPSWMPAAWPDPASITPAP